MKGEGLGAEGGEAYGGARCVVSNTFDACPSALTMSAWLARNAEHGEDGHGYVCS